MSIKRQASQHFQGLSEGRRKEKALVMALQEKNIPAPHTPLTLCDKPRLYHAILELSQFLLLLSHIYLTCYLPACMKRGRRRKAGTCKHMPRHGRQAGAVEARRGGETTGRQAFSGEELTEAMAKTLERGATQKLALQ